MEIDPNLVETGCRYNVICEYIYCIDASDLFQMIPPPGGSKKLSDIQVAQASLKDKHTTSLFSLQPNPARGARKTFRHLFSDCFMFILVLKLNISPKCVHFLFVGAV